LNNFLSKTHFCRVKTCFSPKKCKTCSTANRAGAD